MENLEQIHKVKRGGHRSDHSWETVSDILDSQFIGYFSCLRGDVPIVLPMAYGRVEKTVYIHGAMKNELMRSILESGISSMTVSIADGLVLARSAYHHSLNYRSAVVTGPVRDVTDQEEKLLGLKAVTDQMLEGRWDEVRPPSGNEMKATRVLAFEAQYFVAKSRTGMPVDEKEDEALPIWAGIVPIAEKYGVPETDTLPGSVQELSPSVRKFGKK
ncbi:hypothetical protein FUAX_44760 (plasmid) [Fulvitalea axinellae]|uniref:Pyridoxamine 5'-phosphate oxidase family protein n=1 Tax=Fulvitalea axinellae TaxID=1182444 RepID=A0AAU9CIU7_9BACT|nr:hypothetical protein FUAX_44760 [Fulvitalea axinellae]